MIKENFQLLTKKETAHLLGFKHTSSIDRMAKRGELSPRRIGKSIRFLEDEIIKIITNGKESKKE